MLYSRLADFRCRRSREPSPGPRRCWAGRLEIKNPPSEPDPNTYIGPGCVPPLCIPQLTDISHFCYLYSPELRGERGGLKVSTKPKEQSPSLTRPSASAPTCIKGALGLIWVCKRYDLGSPPKACQRPHEIGPVRDAVSRYLVQIGQALQN